MVYRRLGGVDKFVNDCVCLKDPLESFGNIIVSLLQVSVCRRYKISITVIKGDVKPHQPTIIVSVTHQQMINTVPLGILVISFRRPIVHSFIHEQNSRGACGTYHLRLYGI